MDLLLSRRALLAAIPALAVSGCASISSGGGNGPRFYADGLSFLPDDMEEITASGLKAMICDVSTVEEVRDPDGTPRYRRTFAANDKAIDEAAARIAATPSAFVANRGADIDPSRGCAMFLQFQSAEPMGTDLGRVEYFHRKGLRVLQFTHHNNTLWAGGCLELAPSGLTALGYEGLAELNRLHILPDVAHGSERTMLDAAQASTSPIVMSHGACRALVDHPRCITDRAIRAIADRGGLVGIFMMSFWLTTDPTPHPDHWVAHVRHVINKGGLEAVGIANDFPMAGQANLVRLGNDNRRGVEEYLEWWRAMRRLGLPGFAKDPEHVVIPAFNQINRMATIEQTLERAGFPGRHIDRIMGENWKQILRSYT
ncbi:MAG: membrane dipeptidase [Sphingopyxis sp.]|uniref:membrane dipeptidase n=1 Tax=Sphingopyxis sp. TaxID=1908224 RepID=UPI002AB96083|nr:membrane dipeptidase [Sphingopyxis sp.]MDZ3830781.1 membrane dipeptidase [Sphingopyxis sp.]